MTALPGWPFASADAHRGALSGVAMNEGSTDHRSGYNGTLERSLGFSDVSGTIEEPQSDPCDLFAHDFYLDLMGI